MKVTPRSIARWMVAIDSSQSASPYHSLMPMQPRPCAETVRPPSETLRTLILSCPWSGRADAALVRSDLVVEQFQALLLLAQGLANMLAVGFQQRHPLLLPCPRPDQPGVAEHVAHRHPGGAEPAQQQDPVQIGIAVAAA